MLKKIFDSIFIRSWWVIAFTLTCSIIYEHSLKGREIQYQHLSLQLVQIEEAKKQALIEQKDLQLQINSQCDLAWIELILMRGLGLTPEDQQKIYFKKT